MTNKGTSWVPSHGLLENGRCLPTIYERKLAARDELKNSLQHEAFNGDLYDRPMPGSELRLIMQSRKDAEESRSIPAPTFVPWRLCVILTTLGNLKESLVRRAFSGNLQEETMTDETPESEIITFEPVKN